jgi:hypothetical protein
MQLEMTCAKNSRSNGSQISPIKATSSVLSRRIARSRYTARIDFACGGLGGFV